ncbi:hypothetical protein D3C80_1541420 [compost metagenome]
MPCGRLGFLQPFEQTPFVEEVRIVHLDFFMLQALGYFAGDRGLLFFITVRNPVIDHLRQRHWDAVPNLPACGRDEAAHHPLLKLQVADGDDIDKKAHFLAGADDIAEVITVTAKLL